MKTSPHPNKLPWSLQPASEADPVDTLAKRLQTLRQWMQNLAADAVLIPGSDTYLNEFVPLEHNLCAFFTGFTGSAGDALISHQEALLFVDGRYQLQAREQAPHCHIHVAKLGCSIVDTWLTHLADNRWRGCRLLVPIHRMSVHTFNRLGDCGPSCVPISDAHVDMARGGPHSVVPQGATVSSKGKSVRNPKRSQAGGEATATQGSGLRWISPEISGASVRQHIAAITPFLREHRLQGLFVAALDSVAWLSNLRGSDFPCQSVAAGQVVVLQDELLLELHQKREVPAPLPDGITMIPQGELLHALHKRLHGASGRMGFDPRTAPQAAVAALQDAGLTPVSVHSPVDGLKARKTPAELAHMRDCFARADGVAHRVQQWLCNQIAQNKHVTERDVGDMVWQQFRQSGAVDLSFPPICAAGKHGAVVHYTQLDASEPIKQGQLFLLDIGGIYEGGYSTDLTRTFLVGDHQVKPTAQQKKLFTHVLQAAITGMTAQLPRGTPAAQLDALVRGVLQKQGLNYAHGTGHGVGIAVHESPPRVSPAGHDPLEVGQVFTIEPGVYIPSWGGIRIENVCTLVDDPTRDGYTRVSPLSFAPLDERLIEHSWLTESQQRFIRPHCVGLSPKASASAECSERSPGVAKQSHAVGKRAKPLP